MTIDFSPLASAISQLERSVAYATSEMAENNDGLFEQFRNSVIRCFEFTYELSHKMLKRYLEATAASPEEIDLSITRQPLSLTKLAIIKEAVDESNLSIRVDIVDWATASETFRKIIEQDKVVVQETGGPVIAN